MSGTVYLGPGSRILVGSNHLFGTFPRPIAAHAEAQYVGPVLLANLTDCTHTGSWCVTKSYTTCTNFASYILIWNDRG